MIDVQTAVCKTIQSIGLSPRKEHQIENTIVRQLESSGPEFVIARVSGLVDWRKAHLSGHHDYHPTWYKYKNHNGRCEPADALGSQLWSLSDKAFFAVTGAIKKSFILTNETEKQLTKWVDGVRCENHSDPQVRTKSLSSDKLDKLESDLRKKWQGRSWFNVSDVTGTNIPGSGKFMKVKVDPYTHKKDPRSLLSSYAFSVSTTPLAIWVFLSDIDYPKLAVEGFPETNESEVAYRDRLSNSLTELIETKLESPRLEDEAIMGSNLCDLELAYLHKDRLLVTYTLGMNHSIGNVGFLQQEGGKLRTVGNPNRLAQWANIPLGEVLSEFVQREYPMSFVQDQYKGMLSIQQMLRSGNRISSFDMSSATDRLDYKKFLHEYFEEVYADTERYPLLSRSLELFEDCSQMPWTFDGYLADILNAPVNEMSWTVGQPLGLRPSFPVLTLMNCQIAEDAISSYHKVTRFGKTIGRHKGYACVGDDLVIESRYAEAYMSRVQAYNGKINNDKCVEGDTIAEFCSHLITKSAIYPLKPRFRLEQDGVLANVEIFSTEGLRPKVKGWQRELHDAIAKYAIPGSTNTPYKVTNGPAPLMERIGVNTLLDVINQASHAPEKVSLQTLFMRAFGEGETKLESPVELSTSSAEIDGSKPFGKVLKISKAQSIESTSDVDLSIFGRVASDGSTSVDLPVSSQWDWRSGSYKTKPTGEVATAKKIRKKIQKVKTEPFKDDLVEAASVESGIETRILVDVSDPNSPTALVAYRKGNGPQSVSEVKVEQPQREALKSFAESKTLDEEFLTKLREIESSGSQDELEDDTVTPVP